MQGAEDLARRSREIFAAFLRTNPTPRLKQDAERLAAESAEAEDEGRAIGSVLDENPLPHDTREYPVHAFGIYFASWRVFVGFLLALAYVALAVTFPVGMLRSQLLYPLSTGAQAQSYPMGEDGRLLLDGARFVDDVYTPTVKEAPAA